jgi:ABC-type phosphate/phosphonate transport system ATPase subunit
MTSSKYSVPYWPSAEVIQTKPQCITIAVEGNIGAGKSTLLNHLEQSGFCEVSYAESESENHTYHD